MKRILLFVVTNLAVMLVLGVVTSVFGLNRYMGANGLQLGSLLAYAMVVGFTGVQPWSHPWGPVGSPEVGWRLGREFWGRGYATQAARAAVEHARSAGVGHLIAMIHEANTASFGVARRLGMETEEVLLSPEGTRVHQLGAPLSS